jgi:acyl-CoA synthetase (AMP-forming)/AMP-acid ligase II
VRVGGDGFETKIVDGILWIRSRSAMVGYLNAPSPFDSEGWLNTGDLVEIQGEYLRILGRESDIINVGGQKVFPVEVESVVLQAPNVSDVTVYGEPHPLLGRIVAARVATHTPEDPNALRARIREFCLERLAPYKVPVRVLPASGAVHNDRFKRMRRPDAPTEQS